MDMKPIHNLEALFDRYFNKQLSETDTKAFEQRLANEPELQKAFSDFILLKEVSQESSRDAFKKQFSDLAYPEEQRKSFIRLYRPLAYAASVLILIAASVFIYQQVNYWSTLDSLAQNALITTEHTITYLGEGDEDRSTNERFLEEGKELFQTNQFEEAISTFDKVQRISSEEYDDFMVARFFKARAYIRLRNKEKAIVELQELELEPGMHYLKQEAQKLISLLRK